MSNREVDSVPKSIGDSVLNLERSNYLEQLNLSGLDKVFKIRKFQNKSRIHNFALQSINPSLSLCALLSSLFVGFVFDLYCFIIALHLQILFVSIQHFFLLDLTLYSCFSRVDEKIKYQHKISIHEHYPTQNDSPRTLQREQ